MNHHEGPGHHEEVVTQGREKVYWGGQRATQQDTKNSSCACYMVVIIQTGEEDK